MPSSRLVSVIIPSRNERFLDATVRDVLAKATGPIEIIVVLDGYWPSPALPDDPRLKILHRGQAQGMRPAINDAARIATGEFLAKCDAHVLLAQGWDAQLKADYLEDNWILIPRRYPLDADKWAIQERTDNKYPIDYHFLSEPFGSHGGAVPGLHGSAWAERREARKHVAIDDEIASQGSFWFTSRKHWDRMGDLDSNLFGNFWFENQEMALKTWCMGGRQMVSKNTWYAHLFKGKTHGRGYVLGPNGHKDGAAYLSWFWMTDQPFARKVRSFRSVIESFLPMPTWTDPDAIFARAEREFRNPYEAAA